MTAYFIDGKDARDADYVLAIESLPEDDLDYVEFEVPERGSLMVSSSLAEEGAYLVHEHRPDGSSWSTEDPMTKDEVMSLVGAFLKGGDRWREAVAWDRLVPPLREGYLFRWPDNAGDKLASWCSLWCPLACLVLVIAAQLPWPFWVQSICYTLTAVFFAVGFFSAGFAIASDGVNRVWPTGWFERVFLLCQSLFGVLFMVMGFLGAWMLFKIAVLYR